MAIASPRRSIFFPAHTLHALARAVGSEAGTGAAVRVLQEAGYAAGATAVDELREELGDGPVSDLQQERFWAGLARFFERRGWGRLQEARVHPGMGLVTAHDWAEADGGGVASRVAAGENSPGGCSFTTGMLARILGETAGSPVAVLEVACRSRGDEACRFLFGHEGAVRRSYDLLREGASLDRTLGHV